MYPSGPRDRRALRPEWWLQREFADYPAGNIGYVDVPISIEQDANRGRELPFAFSSLTPHCQKISIGVERLDTLLIGIGNVDDPLFVIDGYAGQAKKIVIPGKQEGSIGSKLRHPAVVTFSDIDIPVCIE